MTSDIPASAAAFVALLGIALLLSIAAERVRVPAAVLLVAAGAAAGSIWHLRPPFAFGPSLLFVFLPPLVFEGAWHIDIAGLRANAWRIAALALPGTLISAVIVAVVLTLCGALPFASALLLGAMVSATDPVAVIAVFRHAAVPARIKTLVEAESLANDGVAVALYGAALTYAAGASVAWVPAALHAVVQILGGAAAGAVIASPIWLLLQRANEPEYEVTATIALAYGAYLAADRLQLSGIFATAAAAIVLRGLLHRSAFMAFRDHVDIVWNSGAFLANAVVFLATGLLIDLPRALHEPLLVGGAVVSVLAARIVLAGAAVRTWASRVTVYLAGMRGALPLALALALPDALPNRAAIVDGVFAVVLVTLVVQGAVLQPLMIRLYGRAPEA